MQIGDTVRFLDSVGGGVVRRIDVANSVAYVEDVEGFEIPTLLSQCVVVSSSADSSQYERRTLSLLRKGPSEMQQKAKTAAEQAAPSRAANGHKEPKLLDQMEVDLHIEALNPGSNALPPSEILQYQLRTVRRIMQEQRLHHGRRIVFIHGKGDGVLRREMIKLLSREFPSSRFMEASLAKYSSGATLVLIG